MDSVANEVPTAIYASTSPAEHTARDNAHNACARVTFAQADAKQIETPKKKTCRRSRCNKGIKQWCDVKEVIALARNA